MGRPQHEQAREKAALPPLTVKSAPALARPRNFALVPAFPCPTGERAMTQQQKPKTTDKRPSKASEIPPAGPHAKPSLTDHDKTPGAGSLPEDDAKDVSPGAG